MVSDEDELRQSVVAYRDHCQLLLHKIITCGVAANHPDPNLSRTGAYASKWDSPQAESVRKLRAELEAWRTRFPGYRYKDGDIAIQEVVSE